MALFVDQTSNMPNNAMTSKRTDRVFNYFPKNTMNLRAFFSQSMSGIKLTSTRSEQQEKTTRRKNATHWSTKSSSRMYQAILNGELEDIKRLLQNGSLIDIPLITTGSLAGYTVLHIACMTFNSQLVKLLVENYCADVNVVANDGAQPIHLACLFEDGVVAEILLEAGARSDTKLGKKLFLKYIKDKKWCSDFGDTMTISNYAVIYTGSFIAEDLIDYDTNLEVKSSKHKTLLMYALENNNSVGKTIILMKSNDQEFINARDDDGFLATHYLLHPKKFGDFRYDGRQFGKYEEWKRTLLISSLISAGADIYATINGDPDTLLLNMAAYRSSASILNQVLPHYDCITQSKALYYATLPIEDPQKLLRPNKCISEQPQLEFLHKQRQLCTELILKDLVNRRTFGLPVPEGEKQLMDQLIATDINIRELVHNYKTNFIQGTLKSKFIQYDNNERITLFDFILKCCSDSQLLLIVKNKIVMEAFEDFYLNSVDYLYFDRLLKMRIDKAHKKIKLLDQLNKIEQLRKFIPSTYCILEIIKYLSNQDLETFIDALVNK